MRERVIISKRDIFKISGISYDYFSANEVNKCKYKKIKIFLLEQDIFTAYILENKYKNVKKAVEEKVITLFNEIEDYLVHYEVMKKDKYIIYSLKSGKKVEALSRDANNIKIIPIQFSLLNNIKKRVKEKNYSFLYYLDEGVYYTKVSEEKIIKSSFSNSIEKLFDFFERDEKIYFYEDERIDEDRLSDYNIFKIKKKRSERQFEKILYK